MGTPPIRLFANPPAPISNRKTGNIVSRKFVALKFQISNLQYDFAAYALALSPPYLTHVTY